MHPSPAEHSLCLTSEGTSDDDDQDGCVFFFTPSSIGYVTDDVDMLVPE